MQHCEAVYSITSDLGFYLIVTADECVDPLVSGLYASSFLASSRYNFLYSANFAKLYGKSSVFFPVHLRDLSRCRVLNLLYLKSIINNINASFCSMNNANPDITVISFTTLNMQYLRALGSLSHCHLGLR